MKLLFYASVHYSWDSDIVKQVIIIDKINTLLNDVVKVQFSFNIR